ncbi:MAG: chemotaxis protein CheW [Gammaproteobacteria bacterium]|nr:chemotaxis protein CheW [Gammaproteobacteria bacterium]
MKPNPSSKSCKKDVVDDFIGFWLEEKTESESDSGIDEDVSEDKAILEVSVEEPKIEETDSTEDDVVAAFEPTDEVVLSQPAELSEEPAIVIPSNPTETIESELESEADEEEQWNALLEKENRQSIQENSIEPAQSVAKQIADLPTIASDERLKKVEQLLARMSMVSPSIQPEISKLSEIDIDENAEVQTTEDFVLASFVEREIEQVREVLPENFQTLIFKVGTMPLAVPLLKLGGIVTVSREDITPMVGTPDWFMGLLPNERGNLMIIDTQKYLMPERCETDKSEEDYQYLIVLDNSNWALACHSVGDAKNLTRDDIRWSGKSSKRPWFGGMVVDYMSALIEVDELINMLAGSIIDNRS